LLKPYGISNYRNILWDCLETSKWKTEVMCKDGVNTSEEFASRTADCKFKTQVRKLGRYQEKATGKWKEKKSRKINVYGREFCAVATGGTRPVAGQTG
jgi:hypothetical protein